MQYYPDVCWKGEIEDLKDETDPDIKSDCMREDAQKN